MIIFFQVATQGQGQNISLRFFYCSFSIVIIQCLKVDTHISRFKLKRLIEPSKFIWFYQFLRVAQCVALGDSVQQF
jgi:hypothetical protein